MWRSSDPLQHHTTSQGLGSTEMGKDQLIEIKANLELVKDHEHHVLEFGNLFFGGILFLLQAAGAQGGEETGAVIFNLKKEPV